MRALLLQNPLLVWTGERLRREKKGLIGLILFVTLVYGIAAFSTFLWSLEPTWRRQLKDLFSAFHYVAWGINVLCLLLWAPTRLAQALAKEKSEETLGMLRMTGLSGLDLAIGTVGTALLLPTILVLTTIPLVLLGLGGVGGLEATVRGYLCLPLLALFYTLFGGMIGLSVKKAQHAGSSAMFAALLALGFTASANVAGVGEMRPVALLGPWGGGLTTLSRMGFSIEIGGVAIPGELIQLPLLVVLIVALATGLGRRLEGERVFLLGRRGALWFAGAMAVISGVTFFPADPTTPFARMPTAASFTSHMVLPFVCTLLLAVETTVSWRDLVRGLARREPDDTPFPDEQLTVRRFAEGASIPFLLGAGLCLGVVYPRLETAFGPGYTSETSVAGLVVGTCVAASAWVFAALVFQLVQLFTKDRGSPVALSSIALGVLWIGPFIASAALEEMSAPAGLYELPRAVSPFFGLYCAGYGFSPMALASSLTPIAMATLSTAIYTFGSAGLVYVLASARRRAQEEADARVALPADAFGAPGSLTQRCDQGHLYSETWTSCPHCAEATSGRGPPS